jgi:hypothetical protein
MRLFHKLRTLPEGIPEPQTVISLFRRLLIFPFYLSRSNKIPNRETQYRFRRLTRGEFFYYKRDIGLKGHLAFFGKLQTDEHSFRIHIRMLA